VNQIRRWQPQEICGCQYLYPKVSSLEEIESSGSKRLIAKVAPMSFTEPSEILLSTNVQFLID
jgi:hypothetical protein